MSLKIWNWRHTEKKTNVRTCAWVLRHSFYRINDLHIKTISIWNFSCSRYTVYLSIDIQSTTYYTHITHITHITHTNIVTYIIFVFSCSNCVIILDNCSWWRTNRVIESLCELNMTYKVLTWWSWWTWKWIGVETK